MLFTLGLISLPFPTVAGLHLTIAHCLIVTLIGGILLWNGRMDRSFNCFLSCGFFGLFFLTHAVAGWVVDFVFGMDAYNPFIDQKYLHFLPDYFILGTSDHVFNLVLGVILLAGAYDWLFHYKKSKFIKVNQDAYGKVSPTIR